MNIPILAVAAWKLNKRSAQKSTSSATFDVATVSISLPGRTAQPAEVNVGSSRDTEATFRTAFSTSALITLDDSDGDRCQIVHYPPNTSPKATSLPSSKVSVLVSPKSSKSCTSPPSTVPSITQYILSVKGKDQLDFGGVVVKAKKGCPDTHKAGEHDAQSCSCEGGSGNGAGYTSPEGGKAGGEERFDTRSKVEAWVPRSRSWSAKASVPEAPGVTGECILAKKFMTTECTNEVCPPPLEIAFSRSAVHFREPSKGGEKEAFRKISFQPAVIRMLVLSSKCPKETHQVSLHPKHPNRIELTGSIVPEKSQSSAPRR